MFCFYIDFTKLWVADEEQNQKINILLFTIYCLKEMQTKKRLYQLQQHSCENYSTRTNMPKAMKRTFISIKIMRYFALSFYPLWVHHMQLCLDDKWGLHLKVFDMHRNVFRYKICVQPCALVLCLNWAIQAFQHSCFRAGSSHTFVDVTGKFLQVKIL